LDVIKRSSKICDKLIISVASDSQKKPLFSVDKRVEMIKSSIKEFGFKLDCEIEVVSFKGLLVGYAQEKNANIIIRGLRAVSDFEYEFQLASMNSRLADDVQTVFLPASEKNHFIASNLVKEVARLGGDISSFVTKDVQQKVIEKFSKT